MERRRTTAPKPSKPPIGYRFHPNDAELADHFLRRKIHDFECENMPIAEVKVCDFEPWDLPEKSKVISTDKTWYFFCPRDFKFANSRRSNRRTKMGFWKPTGKTREVKGIRKKDIVANKKTLVYYEDSRSGKVKTDWVIHEYELFPVQGNFVLCKLKCKSAEKTNFETTEITPASASPTTSEIEVTSSCGEFDPNDNNSADIADQNVGEMADISTYENDEHSCATMCDVENLYSNEVSSCPVNDESNPGCLVISGFDNPNETIATLTFWKHKFCGEETDIFIGRNSDKIINMWDSFAASSDCGTGNEIPYVETDLSGSSVAPELKVISAPLIDVQGPSTFFDDMKMLIEPIVY